jgi:hypothetical protein
LPRSRIAQYGGHRRVWPEKEARIARLTTSKRAYIPANEFAEPRKRPYPVEDKTHVRNAKARPRQAAKAGRTSDTEESKIDSNADAAPGASNREIYIFKML